jgi:catechol 2,3-dioxygenase-like lactoylglutathione lyase family enzyme
VHEDVAPVLRVADSARAVEWYERLGFRKEWEHQFEPGFPWFVSVARGDVRVYLSEHTGDAPPGILVHLYVSDIEAVSAEFGVPVDEEGLAGRECDWKTRTGTGYASRRGRADRSLVTCQHAGPAQGQLGHASSRSTTSSVSSLRP